MLYERVSDIESDIEREYNKYFDAFRPIMRKYLDVTVDMILKHIRSSLIAIYLIGSFGRGEGALYIENNHVEPLRDFDLLLVTTKPIRSDIIIAMTKEIHNKLGISPPTKSFLEEFSIWITYIPLGDLVKGVPLLKYYELKHASIHLYGIDIRPFIDLKLEDISLYNGILILLTKIEGLLTLYPLSETENFKLILNFVYEILKVFTEISTVFSLIDKTIYRPKYSDRCFNFVKVYRGKAPWLFKLIPDLDYYVLFGSMRRKLLTKNLIASLDVNLMKLRVIEALDKVISLYITLGYNIKIPLSGFSNSDKKVLDKVGLVTLANFFYDYLMKVFKVRSKILGKILSIGITPLYLLTSNISFVIRARKAGIPVRIKLAFSTKNYFVRLAHIDLVTLIALVHKDYDELDLILIHLGEYINKNHLIHLSRNATSATKLRATIKLVSKLLRLADASLHKKVF